MERDLNKNVRELLKRLTEERDNLIYEIKERNGKISSLENEIKRSKKEYEAAKGELLNKVNSRLEKLKERFNELTRESKGLRFELSRSHEEKNDALSRMDELNETITDLRSQIESKTLEEGELERTKESIESLKMKKRS
jgi:hypothetical protein